ncbi:DUF4157 domain-containing protein [Trinickia terrae]|uniref:DUF4157 domain-containing protein n=2 Tax=Trinickia terrae TaxID=2571161 RepID=A0A4U1I6E8_9BURK|nr:DUF4157 domain-containing protein [Trinickia terrae]
MASERHSGLTQLAADIAASPRMAAQRKQIGGLPVPRPGKKEKVPVQGRFDGAQLKGSPRKRPVQKAGHAGGARKGKPLQKKEEEPADRSGLPAQLKHGIESLSGYSMDDVKVHYNSSRPAQLQAHAYAQGTDIHLAPGQERHLPHEAWHVVQQKQGRVRPTMQMKGGVPVNDDQGLEREADVMGQRAVQMRAQPPGEKAHLPIPGSSDSRVAQRYTVENGYRISAARELAIADNKEEKTFFAKPAAVVRSNAILAGMKSKVKLTPGAAAPAVLANMIAVTPANREEGKPEVFDVNECIDVADRVTNSGQTHAVYKPLGNGPKHLHALRAYDLGALNKLIEVLVKTPDVAPAHVIDAQKGLEPKDLAPNFAFTLGNVAVATNSPADASNALKPKLPNRNLRIALLANVLRDQFTNMPQVQQEIVDQVNELLGAITLKTTEDKDDAEVETWATLINSLIDQTKSMHSDAYSKMPPQEQSKRAAQLGINEAAQPDIGESYATMSTRKPNEKDGDKWTFHFAAVVARDQNDSITLENYNRRGDNAGNSKWYFDMHGAHNQSFHAKHKDTVADGVTVRMGEEATVEMRAQFVRDIESKCGAVPLPIRTRIQDAKTRAELAAIYADAVTA